MKEQIKIACLPVAGDKNPYQNLMIKGLNEANEIEAFNGIDDRFFGIIRTFLKFKPDYIHFDWIQSYYIRNRFWLTLLMLPLFIFQILFIKYLTKTKLVWTLHNIMPHDTKNNNFHKNVRHFFGSKCLWVRVFSTSTIVRVKQQLNIPPIKLVVIPEGDYTSEYRNEVSRKEARTYLNLKSNELIFLFLGFIKPYKGIENLIDSFTQSSISNSKLLIAGQGINKDYTQKIKNKSSSYNNVEVHDRFIDAEELQYYYNASDVVILPFQKIENSGSVIMAMGFEKVIIAPNIGVLSERLEMQKEYLYDKKIEEILKNSDKLDKGKLEFFGRKNFVFLKKHLWKDFAQQFLRKS